MEDTCKTLGTWKELCKVETPLRLTQREPSYHASDVTDIAVSTLYIITSQQLLGVCMIIIPFYK